FYLLYCLLHSLSSTLLSSTVSFLFFFNDPATTEIYTLSLHDALPIYEHGCGVRPGAARPEDVAGAHQPAAARNPHGSAGPIQKRSEEHTSELQSLTNLVCRLLLEKKKNKHTIRRDTSRCEATEDIIKE